MNIMDQSRLSEKNLLWIFKIKFFKAAIYNILLFQKITITFVHRKKKKEIRIHWKCIENKKEKWRIEMILSLIK